ncbi:MAG TPA: class I SAM-dependent rRNA methyltransferase, partial [Candidatus Binatia bacterium]|nr:class I SAM-dependent rRNA methyltransferase [Candidatus Binatia bacterium]
NSKSKIRVRLLSRERVEINRDFFRERIAAARAVRERHLPGATSFRVVNSESDLLSGLVVDKYEDVLVIQLSALGMDRRKPAIVHALEELFQPRAILERSDVGSRKFEGLLQSPNTSQQAPEETTNGKQPAASILSGSLDQPVPVRLNGMVFETDLAGTQGSAGHKTGMYLDQQVNYRLVAELTTKASAAAQVLDCFTFVGGFALHTARAGASHVHAVDQSGPAIAQAQRNAELNGVRDRCSFEAANVFDWLKAQTTTRPHEKLIPRFDLIILDPPSFTRNRAAVADALRGYKEIHLRALKLLKPGGILATFCCSHHVDAQLFQEVILAAAYDAHRVLRRTAIYTQSSDHPVLPSIPETEYLKGFAFEVTQQY